MTDTVAENGDFPGFGLGTQLERHGIGIAADGLPIFIQGPNAPIKSLIAPASLLVILLGILRMVDIDAVDGRPRSVWIFRSPVEDFYFIGLGTGNGNPIIDRIEQPLTGTLIKKDKGIGFSLTDLKYRHRFLQYQKIH